ncbi:MAG TPA: hypothetical protein VD963_00905 [Phycisphaerales bacterium]|nr:hypothetical protein [Phycisphaerales bacterium]
MSPEKMPPRVRERLSALMAHVPRNPGELRAFLAGLEIAVPAGPALPTSDGPMAYLAHAFFEGRPFGGGVRRYGPADCVVWASRGGGKTFLGAVATVLDLVFKPGIEVRVLGGSLEQSRRMQEHVARLLAHPALAFLVAGRVTERRVALRTGSRAEVLAQSEASVRGTRVQKLRCDEVELFDRGVWEAAQLTTRSAPIRGPWGGWVRGSVEALSTMHRPHGLMWEVVGGSRRAGEEGADGAPRRLFRWGVVDVLGRCGEEFRCAGCGLWDECGGRAKAPGAGGGGHVAVGDALAMKARVGLAAWESEMLCLRPRRADSVYPEFDARVHVADWEEPGARDELAEGPGRALVVGGMDFGFRGPTVFLLGRVGADGVLRITHEHAASGNTMGEHAAAIRALCARAGTGLPDWIGVDPAGRQREHQSGLSNIAVLRGAGLTVRSRVLSLPEGIEAVRARLRPAEGGPRLLVHARCVGLVSALERYHYAPERPESVAPVKDGPDHAADALRYLVVCLDRAHRAERGRYA